MLKETLWDYYGQLNEAALNIRIDSKDRVEKPEALIRYEQIKDLGVPYVAGGLMDQPYLWLQEHATVNRFLAEWEAVQLAQSTNRGT